MAMFHLLNMFLCASLNMVAPSFAAPLPGKYYETKHFVPTRRPNGKLSNINSTFEEMHIEAPAKIAEFAKEMGISRLVHVSSLASDLDSPSRWASTKAKVRREERVKWDR